MTSEQERAALLLALGSARRHVLDQAAGMDEAQLRAVVAPSGWSTLGLLRHLTLSDERYWFEVVVAGGPLDFWPEGPNGDWVVADDEDPDAVLTAYRHAIATSDRILAGVDLDAPPRRPEPGWADSGAFPTVRSVVLHVIVETSTHAGQLDLVREVLDGHQHLVL
ncbi:protein of unknown function DUF664 [Beutenbergia cavernae DSM 12333]|uniref:Mini-circle protein n=1 Tax=Beutenbergia cavernae (strain ATCC BAA-8 / DSM 12333 / CCUG 43141 / JCM 11478 / NBRC 16432 / NCIMB 13614 / HKI 0122) TaxID=471853 RepID=C5BYD9_BEUC1|nr:DinB family protein [Beutenbergia cavernae]ACQ81039.1 protein of unknown function DUF664 [Beutenbergia cavernae DSM 12333]